MTWPMNRYEDAVLRTGLPTGTPQEALDTACTIHLTQPTKSAECGGVPAERVADFEFVAVHAGIVDFQGPTGGTAR